MDDNEFKKEMKELDKSIEDAVNEVQETTKAFRIKKMIDARLKNNDYEDCYFSVLILDNSIETSFKELLSRYNYNDYTIDTVSGCWNLNDDWYQFRCNAIIEWSAVYPIDWNLADIIYLEELYNKRKIYIQVYHKVSGNIWEPIH